MLPALLMSLFLVNGVMASDRPNMVLIMCDDMGFSDLGCYGSEIETPHIDTLAESGVRFSNFKNTGRCCPSRASLMTGRYQHAVGMGWMTAVDEQREGYRGELSRDVPTIAEILKQAGYGTYLAGKWHLSLDAAYKPEGSKPNGSWPTERGFDEFYGSLTGGGSYRKVKSLKRNTSAITDFPKDYYYTHAITEHAVQFVEEHDKAKPLFMYLAHYAPHRSLQAPQERIDQCMERYKVGYDVLRAKRLERLAESGLIPEESALVQHHQSFPEGKRPSWDELPEARKKLWIKLMATYAAMIEVMDDGIGEVIEALKAKGMYEDTVFLFLSDNGGDAKRSKDGQLGADLSNTPYRNYKTSTYTGGTCSPLIIHSEKLGLEKGSVRHALTHINDIVPTCLEFAGVDYPAQFNGKKLAPVDGQSLTGVLENDRIAKRDLFFEHQTSCAVISGDYKLVRAHSAQPWELIHLKNDPFETKDLSQALPEKVVELEKRWNEWAAQNSVLPLEPLDWNDRISHYEKLKPNQD